MKNEMRSVMMVTTSTMMDVVKHVRLRQATSVRRECAKLMKELQFLSLTFSQLTSHRIVLILNSTLQ